MQIERTKHYIKHPIYNLFHDRPTKKIYPLNRMTKGDAITIVSLPQRRPSW